MGEFESIRRRASGLLSVHPRLQYPISFIHSKAIATQALFRRAPIGSEFPNFLFIVSSGRSGSTLLRRLLMEHCSIYIPPETYIFPSLVRTFIDCGATGWPEKVAMTLGRFQYSPEFETFGEVDMAGVYRKAVALPISERTLGGIIKVFFMQLSVERNCESAWLGDKTPANTFNIGLVRKIFPRARFVHIVRDPVDVIDSIARMYQHGGKRDAAVRWRKSIDAWQRFQRAVPSSLRAEVKYEDLVNDVPGTLDKVTHVFGLPTREEKNYTAEVLGDVGARAHHDKVLEPVSRDSIGKGRARLLDEDRNVIAPIVNDRVGLYGYEPI